MQNGHVEDHLWQCRQLVQRPSGSKAPRVEETESRPGLEPQWEKKSKWDQVGEESSQGQQSACGPGGMGSS